MRIRLMLALAYAAATRRDRAAIGPLTPTQYGFGLGLGVGFAVVPRTQREKYQQYVPRTAEAWRKRMKQRTALIPLSNRVPAILAVAVTCSVLMVRPPRAQRTFGSGRPIPAPACVTGLLDAEARVQYA